LANHVFGESLVLLVPVDRVLIFPAVLVILGQILHFSCHFSFTSSPVHAVSPHAAPFSAFSPSSAHLMRAGLIGMPRFASTWSRSIAFTSSSVLAFNSSVRMDADAWLIAQPFPVKCTSST